jgi:hypothetical protein
MAMKYRVQKLVKVRGRTASGQVDQRVGAVWETIAVKGNKATAERIANHARIDNPNSQIRIEERQAS